MSQTKTSWILLMATCLLFQTMIVHVASAPPPDTSKTDIEERQSPLTPMQFSLAATRFIVLLPFIPLLMLVPGATGVLMPMFQALQDRLTTISPNLGGLNIFGIRPGGSSHAGTGSVSNQGVTVATTTKKPVVTTTAIPTYYRFKRDLLKRPKKKINEGFKEVFQALARADDVLNLLTSSQSDCRRQAVCRMHHSVDPDIGSFLGNVIELFNLESKVEKLDISENFKSFLKEVLQAAHAGLMQQECTSVYSKCSSNLVRSLLG